MISGGVPLGATIPSSSPRRIPAYPARLCWNIGQIGETPVLSTRDIAQFSGADEGGRTRFRADHHVDVPATRSRMASVRLEWHVAQFDFRLHAEELRDQMECPSDT